MTTLTICMTLEAPVPLSEEELRLLEQMERALVEEDPKFASTLRGTSMRASARRRAILAGFAFVGGVALLMAGAVLANPSVGIVGFVLMLASATVALSGIRSQQAASGAARHRATGREGLSVIDGGRRSPRRTAPHLARPRPLAGLLHGAHRSPLERSPRARRLLTASAPSVRRVPPGGGGCCRWGARRGGGRLRRRCLPGSPGPRVAAPCPLWLRSAGGATRPFMLTGQHCRLRRPAALPLPLVALGWVSGLR